MYTKSQRLYKKYGLSERTAKAGDLIKASKIYKKEKLESKSAEKKEGKSHEKKESKLEKVVEKKIDKKDKKTKK